MFLQFVMININLYGSWSAIQPKWNSDLSTRLLMGQLHPWVIEQINNHGDHVELGLYGTGDLLTWKTYSSCYWSWMASSLVLLDNQGEVRGTCIWYLLKKNIWKGYFLWYDQCLQCTCLMCLNSKNQENGMYHSSKWWLSRNHCFRLKTCQESLKYHFSVE